MKERLALWNWLGRSLVWGVVVCSLSGGVAEGGTAPTAPFKPKDPPTQAKTKEGTNPMQSPETTKESPFACNMAALTKKQRTRIWVLLKELQAKKQEVRELPDGFAFRFPMDSDTLSKTAEYVTYERLCCPFFDFEIRVEREGGALWLHLKGREGVKEFIRMEFGF